MVQLEKENSFMISAIKGTRLCAQTSTRTMKQVSQFNHDMSRGLPVKYDKIHIYYY